MGVVGTPEGIPDGEVGFADIEGDPVGAGDGELVGVVLKEGLAEGPPEGGSEGVAEGRLVGPAEGSAEGAREGTHEGDDGIAEG